MLKDTLSKFFKVESLIENLTGFVETRVELLKLEVKEDVAKGLAKGVAWFVIGFVLTLFLVFASIGLALLIGATLGLFAGFMIIASLAGLCWLDVNSTLPGIWLAPLAILAAALAAGEMLFDFSSCTP